jgi:hypothetical protein
MIICVAQRQPFVVTYSSSYLVEYTDILRGGAPWKGRRRKGGAEGGGGG